MKIQKPGHMARKGSHGRSYIALRLRGRFPSENSLPQMLHRETPLPEQDWAKLGLYFFDRRRDVATRHHGRSPYSLRHITLAIPHKIARDAISGA